MHLKIILFFIFVFAAESILYSQASNSLSPARSKKFEKASKGQMLAIQPLLDSADFYLKTNRNKAFEFLEDAYLLSLDKRFYLEQYKVLLKLGAYYEYYKQPDLAALNYENALKVIPRSDAFEVVLQAGNQYLLANFPRNSINLYKKYWPNSSENQQLQLLNKLGDAYQNLKLNDSAIYFYRKAESLSKKLNNTEENISAKLKIAKILAIKNTGQEYELLNSANVQSKVTNNQKMQIESESQLADYYEKNNLKEEEIASRNTVIEVIESNVETLKTENFDVDFRLIDEQIRLANAYVEKKDYQNALLILENIFAKKTKIISIDILALKKEAAKLRSELYLKTNQQQKALRSYEEYSLILNDLYKMSERENDTNSILSSQLRDHQWRIDFLEKDKSIYDAEMQAIAQESDNQKQRLNFQKWFIVLLVTISILLIGSLILFISKYRVEQKHNAYLALKSLRSQMNPHFIFNALNSINNFIAKNDELNANKYLGRFSKLMRIILNTSEEDFIPLEKEIEIIELYLQIENMRFEDKFRYEFNIDENVDVLSFNIPPMMIQPYIENAIWHGLRYLDANGLLIVDLKMENNFLKIHIQDNGIGRKKSMELKTKNQMSNESKGIKNTKSRLNILAKMYKKEIRHNITDLNPDGSGTVVEIWIPNLKS